MSHENLQRGREWPRPSACFAGGTLVHTKDGLVHIEKVKIGDWVMSKPERGGERALKRVLNTVQRESETVVSVLYACPEDLSTFHVLTVTPGQKFWIDGHGWTPVYRLTETIAQAKATRFELVDGRPAYLHGPYPIYLSSEVSIGWTPYDQGGEVRRKGDLWDYANHRLVANGVLADARIRERELSDPYLRLPVFSLEVEDFHTYYVAEAGVWVHNGDGGAHTSWKMACVERPSRGA